MKSAGSHKQPVDAALFELILESAGEGSVLVQSDKTIGYINQVGREILYCPCRNDSLPSFTDLTTLLGFDTHVNHAERFSYRQAEGVALHLAA